MASKRGWGFGFILAMLLLAALAWVAREPLADWMGRLDIGGASEPSETLARSAESKLERIAREGLRDEVRFSEAELQSLLTYRSGPVLPPGIEDPRIDVQDSIVALSALLRPAELDEELAPEGIMAILSDTSRIVSGLVPDVERPGEILVRVRSLQVGTIVIPPLMMPALVAGLRSQGVPTSDGAVVIRVTPDVADVTIDGDEVVLSPALSGR